MRITCQQDSGSRVPCDSLGVPVGGGVSFDGQHAAVTMTDRTHILILTKGSHSIRVIPLEKMIWKTKSVSSCCPLGARLVRRRHVPQTGLFVRAKQTLPSVEHVTDDPKT